MEDIYNRRRKLDNLIEKLQNPTTKSKTAIIDFKKISPFNRKKLLEYNKYCSVEQGLTVGRTEKLIRIMSHISMMLGKDFNTAKRDDIMKVVEEIDKQKYSEWTKYDYKIILKMFWRWLKKIPKEEKIYPKEVSWVRPRIKNGNHKLPEDLLTKDEIDKMVEVAENPRDRAFVRSLAESACRIGEISSLKIKDVAFDGKGCVIIVNGKTGQRRIRLVESTQLLGEWLNLHPFKEDREASLWLGQWTKNKNKFMTYRAYVKIIEKSMEKTNIKKRVHPHLFRHSRLTELANYLTESQLKEFSGWTQSSEMASVYVHMSGKNLDKKILEINGIEVPEEKKLKPSFKICDRCKEKNDNSKTFCGRCGAPLDFELTLNKRQRIESLVDELIGLDESEVEEMKEKIKERKISKEIVKMTAPELYKK